jgi:hypothetical protein
MQVASIAGSKAILSTDAADVGRVLAFAVDVDVVPASVTPAIRVVQQPDSVDKAEKSPRPVGVEQLKSSPRLCAGISLLQRAQNRSSSSIGSSG